MLVLYGRLTFQPVCVFHGLNKGLNCVCDAELNNHVIYTPSHAPSTTFASSMRSGTMPASAISSSDHTLNG